MGDACDQPTATTTTLSPATTTTTTLPPAGCEVGATFASVRRRLEAAIAAVSAAPDLGRLQASLLAKLHKAKALTQHADALRTAGAKRARREVGLLRQAGRQLKAFASRLRSRAGRKLPRPTRDRLLGLADPIRADLGRLRVSELARLKAAA